MTDVTEQARAFAAAFLSGLRRQDLAAMVLAGAGDDFPEVLAATALIEDLSARSDHFAAALKTYADPEFWDEDLPGGALAVHDKGAMARNVLAGREPFYNCE